MVQLNLLPDVKKEFLQAQRTRNSVITICIFVSVVFVGVLVVLAVIMGGQAITKNVVTNDIKKNAATIQNTEELNEYLTVQNQLSHIDALKEVQPVYSRLFDYLVKLNPASPNNVELTSVKVTNSVASGGTANSIELQGSTANFASLDVFKTTLQNAKISYTDKDGNKVTDQPLFNTVTVKEASISRSTDEGRVNFTIDVEYNPEAFDNSAKDFVLTVPNQTTSDADRNTPKEIFGNSNTTTEEDR